MADLPHIYRRMRPKLVSARRQMTDMPKTIPDVVIELKLQDLPDADSMWDEKQHPDKRIPLSFWECFWVEIKNLDIGDGRMNRLGILNAMTATPRDDETGLGHCTGWVGAIFDAKGRPVKSLDMARLASGDTTGFEDFDLAVASMLFRTLYLVDTHYGTAASDKPEALAPLTEWVDPPRPNELPPSLRMFERRKDTVTYHRMSDQDVRRSVAPAPESHARDPNDEPSCRMRDHSVRGHWRTYRSGRRVWINTHRRGDPELGTVTKVLMA